VCILMKAVLRRRLVKRIGVPVEQTTIYAGTVKTAYLSAGKGHPVVFVHGTGVGGITWAPIFGTLSTNFHLIAPDIVGYGESDKPSAPYDRAFFCDWLRDFIDALGFFELSLVGSSQGGAIAVQFTLDQPDRVKSLVLVSPAGMSTKGIALGVKLGMIWVYTLPSKVSVRWMARYVVNRPQSPWTENLTKYFLEVIRSPGGRRVFWQGRGRAMRPFPTHLLRKIIHPTLVLWGERDLMLPLAHAERAKREISKAQLYVIKHAGHAVPLDQPEAFCSLVGHFLSENT